MSKLSPDRILALIIFIYSLVVMTGWIFNIDFLVRIFPNSEPMAFVTAFSFFLSSIALWMVGNIVKGDEELPFVILPATILATLLVMSTVIASGLFGVYTGISDLFIAGNTLPPSPGMPAFMTVTGFALFDIACMLSFFTDLGSFGRIISLFEYLIIAIGSVAVVGYLTNIPLLTYQFSSVATPMALNTALTFIFLGFGILEAEKIKTG